MLQLYINVGTWKDNRNTICTNIYIRCWITLVYAVLEGSKTSAQPLTSRYVFRINVKSLSNNLGVILDHLIIYIWKRNVPCKECVFLLNETIGFNVFIAGCELVDLSSSEVVRTIYSVDRERTAVVMMGQ